MTDEKLDRIIELLERLEKQHRPPSAFSIITKWIFQHFFTLMLLGVLAYVTWEIWQVVAYMMDVVNSMEGKMDSMGESFDGFKESMGNSLEKIKNFNIKDIF